MFTVVNCSLFVDDSLCVWNSEKHIVRPI